MSATDLPAPKAQAYDWPAIIKDLIGTAVVSLLIMVPIVAYKSVITQYSLVLVSRWDTVFIRDYMVTFGLISSVFDMLTFGVLLWVFHAAPPEFRTGWFVESVISASAIVLVIRTRRACFSSKPGRYLLLATLAVAALTLLLPYTPLAAPLGFTPMPLSFLLLLAVILIGYVMTAEFVKRRFYATAPG